MGTGRSHPAVSTLAGTSIIETCDGIQMRVISHVEIDVFGKEPVDPDNPLFKLPNVVTTPHIAGVTDGTSRRRAATAAENCDRIAAGQTPLFRVDV